MTGEWPLPNGSGLGRRAIDDREFSIARRGYDQIEVKAYLAELEDSFVELEAWADRMNAKLQIAEERVTAQDDLEAATLAIFAEKERVLDEARDRAEQIEADAVEQARLRQKDTTDQIIANAQSEARRIIETALTSSPQGVEVQAMESELVEPWPVEPTEPGAELVEPPADNGGAPSPAPAEEIEWERLGFGEPAPFDDDDLTIVIDDSDDGADKQSRYERTSAKLPSLGDGASHVHGDLEKLRPEGD